jgi:hypothetical protein
MMRSLKVCAVSFVSIFMVGCVGMGVTASPADGRFSLDFQARDCITDNIAGRTISAIPVVGDWAMLNWGCNTAGPMVGE